MRHSVLRLGGLRPASVTRLSLIAAFALIAGCEGAVTMDLATEPPANPNINQVAASVRGLQFTTSSGSTKRLEFTASERLDFMDYVSDGNELRMFTSEELGQGNYTGVRLLFDDNERDNALVTRRDGTEFRMQVADGEYAALQFQVEENDDKSESFTLMLDLRQSLSFNDDDEYDFKPVLRAVKTGDRSRIEGNVTAPCGVGDSLSRGAVYLFKGKNVTPDDLDGAGVEPFATAPVLTSQAGSSFFYALRVLPEGDYTLALTCRGNDDDLLENENLDFRNIVNVELDRGQTLKVDLT